MAQDLYSQWLGVKPGSRPPDHYALLCLPTFTHTLRAIEAASRAQLDKLDQYAISPDREKREVATRMMNEVAAARLTLADAARRQAYDQQLAAKLGVEVPRDDDMGATVVGGASVMSSALDIGTIVEETATPEMAAADDVPEEIFAGAAKTLQNMADYEGTHRRSTIPFGVAVLIGALALLLVAGIIVILAVTFSGGESEPDEPKASAPLVPQLPPKPQAPPPVVYDFDDGALPIACQVRRGEPTVADGKLALQSPDGSVVAVELTPKQDLRLFREATIELALTPGGRFTFGIGAAARLTVAREEGAITFKPIAGRRLYADSGELIEVADTEALTIRLSREEGSVDWFVNDLRVAVGSDMPTRGIPTLVIEVAGPEGASAAIDRVEVKYDP